MQVNPNDPISSLSAYLNTILSTSTQFLFFFQNVRIIHSLTEILETQSFPEEETFVIDYMPIEDQTFEWSVQLEDIVISLSKQGNNSENALLANTHNGKLFKICDGPEELHSCCRNATDMHGITGNSVILLADGTICRTFDDPIVEIASCGADYAVGLSSKKIIIVSGGASSEIQQLDFFRSLVLTDKHLFWIESLNMIFKHDRMTGQRIHFESDVTFTKIAVFEDTIYAGTSNGKLVIISGQEMAVHDIPVRACKDIAVNKERIAVLSHLRAIILDRATLSLCADIIFEAQANSVLFANELLYVAHGDRITAYSLEKISIR